MDNDSHPGPEDEAAAEGPTPSRARSIQDPPPDGDEPSTEPTGSGSQSGEVAAGSGAEADARVGMDIEAVAEAAQVDRAEAIHAQNVTGETAPSGASPSSPDGEATSAPRSSAAGLVAAGIFLSRIMGLIRERAVGYFFGLGPHADVLLVALKTPNFLQNLLGEGTISAAFIPIYSRMLEEGREEDAGRFAGAVFGLLVVVVTILVGLGVLLARPLLTVILAGWLGDADKLIAGEISINRFELAVATVRITFPMAGVLVLSAWALGILNSHRKFFLPYFAPVLWNAAIIAGMIVAGFAAFGDPTEVGALDVIPAATSTRLLWASLIGALVGGGLQFFVQLPTALKLMRGFRPSVSTKVEGVRASFKAFVPVVLGRGAYQLSGYLDTFLAGFLAAGAIAAQAKALVLYMLPISLFGMSVAASELPELSRISKDKLHAFLERVQASLGQILYLVVPTSVGYLIFGFLVVGAFFQTGQFDLNDTWLSTLVLGAYSLGLIATTSTRLLQNAFYALNDTKTPAQIAVGRLVVSASVGAALMFVLDRIAVEDLFGIPYEGIPLRMGAVGLALGASLGAWVELFILTRALRRHDPEFKLPWSRTAGMVGIALLAAIPASILRWALPVESLHIIVIGALVVGVYGLTYLGLGHAFGYTEGEAWTGRFLGKLKRKKEGADET